MPIIERIEHIRQEVAERNRREEETSMASDKARENADKVRRDSIKRQAEQAFQESGVLMNFLEIDNTLLKTLEYHKISEFESGATSHEPGYENRIVEIRWGAGNTFSITAEFDHQTEDLTISGKDKVILKKTEWSDNEIVERAIAEAFINPRYDVYVPSSYEPSYEPFDGGNC